MGVRDPKSLGICTKVEKPKRSLEVKLIVQFRLEKKEKSDAAAAYETVDEGLTSDTTDKFQT